jgi:hypothetical protein
VATAYDDHVEHLPHDCLHAWASDREVEATFGIDAAFAAGRVAWREIRPLSCAMRLGLRPGAPEVKRAKCFT